MEVKIDIHCRNYDHLRKELTTAALDWSEKGVIKNNH